MATVQGIRREESLSEESIHNILRNGRRRRTIDYLRENGDQVQVRDLAEHIAELETDTSPAPRNIRNSVYVALHQTHLPKLDEHEIVKYDTMRKTVELADDAEMLEPYFLEETDESFPWAVLYLGSSLTASLIIAGSVIGLPGISIIEPEVWAVGYVILAIGLIGFEISRQQYSIDFDRLRKLRNVE